MHALLYKKRSTFVVTIRKWMELLVIWKDERTQSTVRLFAWELYKIFSLIISPSSSLQQASTCPQIHKKKIAKKIMKHLDQILAINLASHHASSSSQTNSSSSPSVTLHVEIKKIKKSQNFGKRWWIITSSSQLH